MPIYRIKDWKLHFENNRTRELKVLAWVPVPNKMDGDGYTELVSHPSGAAHLGAWLAMVEIASRCEPRGTLVRAHAPQEGATRSQEPAPQGRTRPRPHDSGSPSRISRLPAAVFDEVIPRLLEIGWIEEVSPEEVEATDIPQEGATRSQEPAPSRARAEGNGREGNGTEGKGTEGEGVAGARASEEPPPPKNPPPPPPESLRDEMSLPCDDEYLAGLQAEPAYSRHDVRNVFDKMVAKCSRTGKRPNRGRLIAWLNREPPGAQGPRAGPSPPSKVERGLSAVRQAMDEERGKCQTNTG